MSRKTKKGANILPMHNNAEVSPFLDALFDEINVSSVPPFGLVDDGGAESIITAILDSTKYLTGTIIENRVRNSEKISDEDIYKVYSKSFSVALKTIELKKN